MSQEGGEKVELPFGKVYIMPSAKKIQASYRSWQQRLAQLLFERDQLNYHDMAYLKDQIAKYYAQDLIQTYELEIQKRDLLVKLAIEYVDFLPDPGPQIEEWLNEKTDYRNRLETITEDYEKWSHANAKASIDPNRQKQVRKLYHQIIEAVHPYTQVFPTEDQRFLYQKARTAFKNQQLELLELVHFSMGEEYAQARTLTTTQMIEARRQMIIIYHKIYQELSHIRSQVPYVLKDYLIDDEGIEIGLQRLKARQVKLTEQITELQDMARD